MTAVKVKRSDIGVIFSDTLAATGLADLDDVTVVLFLMHNLSTGERISIAGDKTTGMGVEYVTQDGDLDTAGLFRQEWELTFTDGSVLTFPSANYNIVEVLADLDPPTS